MKIVALSDIHGERWQLERVAVEARSADLVLVAGDITDFGSASEAGELLDMLAPLGGTLAAVGGNCDRRSVRDLLAQRGASVDGRLIEAGEALVAGAGGGMMRTGLTPYERHDEELGSSLELALTAVDGRHAGGRPIVVLTHHPPWDSGADERRGAKVGSRSLRELLDRLRPALWVCGHIHESRSARTVGSTLVLNPGPLREGFWARVELRRAGSGVWEADAELLP